MSYLLINEILYVYEIPLNVDVFNLVSFYDNEKRNISITECMYKLSNITFVDNFSKYAFVQCAINKTKIIVEFTNYSQLKLKEIKNFCKEFKVSWKN